MNLLIMGAPGTGKGTMSALIKDEYHVTHISTGDMLRQAIKEKTKVGLLAQEYINKGALVPDETIHNLIVERLSKDDIKNGFLFDGYPRTSEQAVDLDKILASLGMKIDHVINLNVDEEVLKNRITGRRICENCKEIYHIVNKIPKNEGVCDLCGGNLIQRKDDTLEALNQRLVSYYNQTKPVIDYYKDLGLISTVNANQEVEKVFADIKSVLGD